jgi:hypothetical protein
LKNGSNGLDRSGGESWLKKTNQLDVEILSSWHLPVELPPL